MREEFQQLLSLPYKPGEVEKLESLSDLNKNTSVAMKLYMKLILDYLNTGNPRLMELIMRYSGGTEEVIGQEPQEEQSNGLIEALNAQAAEVWKDEPSKE